MAVKIGPFSTKVDDFVVQVKKYPNAVYRESLRMLINKANRTTNQGGNMPFKSGFLRASLRIGIGSRPRTEKVTTRRRGFRYTWDSSHINRQIAAVRMDRKDKVYIVWIARYARLMENRYGFAALAAQSWFAIVQQATAKVRKSRGES